jgi:hypothetical protein
VSGMVVVVIIIIVVVVAIICINSMIIVVVIVIIMIIQVNRGQTYLSDPSNVDLKIIYKRSINNL